MQAIDSIVLLLVDDSDSDAQAFRFRIVKNPELGYDVQLHHVRSFQEAIDWLMQQPEPPYLICLDGDLLRDAQQANLRQQLQQISSYARTVWLSSDDSDAVVRILRRHGAEQDVFKKKATLWGEDQRQFLALLNEIVAQRSSGKTREMFGSLVRLEEQIRVLQREIDELSDMVCRHHATLYEGGVQSLVAIALHYSQRADQLSRTADVEELAKRIKDLEKILQDSSLQLKLKRADFWYGFLSRLGVWGVACVLLMGFALALGIERAIELLRVLLQR